jgi:Fe-S cluster biosynthesis and repair protein YggX
MTRLVKCAKLGMELEGFEEPPFPGPKGQEIYEKISKQAWQQWIAKQTMLINEYRLASFDPKAKAFLAQERNKFLFEGNDEMPEGYVPPQP